MSMPIVWTDIRPYSFIGHRDAYNSSVVLDALVDRVDHSLLIGLRMQQTSSFDPNGVIFSALGNGSWYVHGTLSAVTNGTPAVFAGVSPAISPGAWHTYRADANGTSLSIWVDGTPVIAAANISAFPTTGHAAIGTRLYGDGTLVDNFELYSAYATCGETPLVPGAAVGSVECPSEIGRSPGSQWAFSGDLFGGTGTFSLRAAPTLCLAATPAPNGDNTWPLVLALCNNSDSLQVWRSNFGGVSPDGERSSTLVLADGRCMDIASLGDIGTPADAWPCNSQRNELLFYDYDEGVIASEAYSLCLGVC